MSQDLSKRLQGALLRIRGDHPFFGTLALFADLRMTDQIPTAATDGKRIWFNPKFIDKLEMPALCGLVAHELLHAALRHGSRRRERDALLWNIAADVVVNGMIRADTGYSLPEGGVEMPKLAHLSVEEVYEQLATGRHRLPKLTLLDLGAELPDSGMGPGSEGILDEHSQQELERLWNSALQQADAVTRRIKRGFGSSGLGSMREFGQARQAPQNWRDLLWQFMVSTPFDFGGFDRRFIHRKLYLEETVGESVEVAICIDTSASIGKDELGQFMAEIQSILDAYPQIKGTLFYADADLYGPHAFGADAAMPEVKGGGGTSFKPFFQWVERENAHGNLPVCIYFTDGYGDFPSSAPDSPVLWLVLPGGLESSRYPFGEVVRMGTAQR
jgi:predicted metal-dependent peptidase